MQARRSLRLHLIYPLQRWEARLTRSASAALSFRQEWMYLQYQGLDFGCKQALTPSKESQQLGKQAW